MRILGLDFGSKTVGVAVSDELLITAQGVEIVRRKSPSKLRQTLARIEEIIAEYKVDRIVLGYPKNMNNTEGERCEKTKEFGDMLARRTGLEVIYWDERLTTVAADRSMMETGIRRENRKEFVDEIAAIFILQGYLDYLSNSRSQFFMQKIKFTDPQTNDVVEFAVEEETTLNGTRYLLVSEGEESGDCEAYILKEVSTKDEEVLYQMVEDDVEFSAIAKVFSELTDDDTALEYQDCSCT